MAATSPAFTISSLNRELLAAPIRLAITTDTPKQYPAWNMDYEQVEAAPRAYVSGPAKVRIVERGPVRVALEVTRQTENSTFTQTIRLSAGDAGNRVEIGNAIDWRGLAAQFQSGLPAYCHPIRTPLITGILARSSGLMHRNGNSKSARIAGSTSTTGAENSG